MDFKQYSRCTVSELPAPDSIRRKISVEEIFENLHSEIAFIRKINYEEIYGYQKETLPKHLLENASKPGSTGVRGCAIRNVKFQSTVLNPALSTNFQHYKSDNHVISSSSPVCEETPMEIDSSSDQLMVAGKKFRKMNRNEQFPGTTKFRKRKGSLNQTTSTSRVDNETRSRIVSFNESVISRFSKTLFIVIGLLMLVLMYIVVAGDHFIYVNKSIQLDNIKKDLQEYVMHQEDAITVIAQTFETMDSWINGVKVLPFVGSTGVGKTFTVNIIKKHFLPQLVHEVDINQLKNKKKLHNIIDNLNTCCCNLIIIDNLKASDFDDLKNFVASLPKSFVLLIIPVFNIQDTLDGVVYTISEDDFKLIRDDFEKSKLHYELVLFDMLKSHVIEKWLRKELHRRQIKENRHDSLVKFLLDNNQVKYKGFKGLNSQLLLALDGN